jgi:predicted RNase H-like nuclease (RuvC/YqgF family)
VATIRGRPYYNITSALKLMEMQFDSLSPEEAASSSAKVIITTRDEAIIVNRKGAVMLDTELAILKSIIGDRADDQLTIGIDPGSRIGISAIYLHQEISSAVESTPEDAVDQVSAMLGGIESHKKVVKIGDGDISMARQIARMIKMKFHSNVSVEIVDEHGTSQNADANRRGARDRSSARTIAFRSGRSFTLR